MGEAGWDDLPKLAAFLILDKLYDVIDRIRFGVVSTYWHIIVEEYKELKPKRKELPMLMVPATNNHNKRRLYNVFEQKMHSVHLSVPNEIVIGACYGGWLAFANHKTLVIKLVNPFKNVDPIVLPPLEWEDGLVENSLLAIKKVVLSADPLVSSSYVVLAILGSSARLRVFKSGQNRWGNIYLNNISVFFSDVILCKNTFYAVNNIGDIVSFEANSVDDYDKLKLNLLHRSMNFSSRIYVVESSKGDLLMIYRKFARNRSEEDKIDLTKNIKIYKLVFDSSSKKLIELVEMTSLNGDTIFIGFNYTYCVFASDYPNCIPNSIYFTNDYFYKPCDLGIYKMEDQSFGDYFNLQGCHRQFKAPIWIFPPV